MEAYRDQYATVFNGGKNVKVLAISTDADTTLASWAAEKNFPVTFGSDSGGTVGALYGAWNPTSKANGRHVIVIGPDGRIAHEMRPFRQMSGEAYEELERAVDRAAGTTAKRD